MSKSQWREILAMWLMTFGDREAKYMEYSRTPLYQDTPLTSGDMARCGYFDSNYDAAVGLYNVRMQINQTGLDFLAGGKGDNHTSND